MAGVKLCKCPYCFERFKPNWALFKASTVFEKMDEKKGTEQLYNKRTDRKLQEFRNKFPDTDWHGNDLDDEDNYDDHLLLCVHNQQVDFPSKRTEDDDIDYSEFEDKDVIMRGVWEKELADDSDEFVPYLMDRYSHKTTVRVCPHCHNRLPLEFGKYETKYIAVVGITSSGKTVYLSQLFKNIDRYLAHADLVRLSMNSEMDQFVKNHPVKAGEKLPQGTGAAHFTMPIPIVVQNSTTKQKYMLIFYDIAGENCINPEQMRKFGSFICNADGIIMITDPRQLDELFLVGKNNDDDDDAPAPGRVLNAMYDAFLSEYGDGTKVPPVAAAISKSDLLRDVIPENSYIFRNTDFNKYNGQNGFPYDDFNNVNTELGQKLGTTRGDVGQGGIYKKALEANFKDYAFFAFSALNCEPPKSSDEELQETPDPLRLEDPLIWLMYKLGMVNEIRKTPVKPRKKGLFW